MQNSPEPVVLGPIRVAYSERVFFAGHTGSGKTTLAKQLLMQAPRFVVYDPKETFRMPDVPITSRYLPDEPRQIIRMPDLGTLSEIQFWETQTARVRATRAPNVLYIDELTFCTQPRTMPRNLGKAIRAGRELNLAVWTTSQRPKDIPNGVLTECDHFFGFRLTYKPDRDKLQEFGGDDFARSLTEVRGYQFAWHNISTEQSGKFILNLREGSHSA